MLIYAPRDSYVPKSKLRDSWDSNPHGSGFAVARDGFIHVVKERDLSWKEIHDLCRKYQAYNRIIHFRLATSGKKNNKACHPFTVASKGELVRAVMGHNGVITGLGSAGHSDTQILARILRASGRRSAKPLANMIRGVTNETDGKFVVMDHKGRVEIVNESAGTWLAGVWYSNTYFRRWEYTWNKTTISTPKKAKAKAKAKAEPKPVAKTIDDYNWPELFRYSDDGPAYGNTIDDLGARKV